MAWAIWITGLPASGKSTVAKKLAEKLKSLGVKVQILESDELRKVLTPKPTYSEEERDWFYSTMVFIGKLLVDNGINVIFDATANRRKYRSRAREVMPKFLEVYVKCPLEVCIERDRKGLYKAAFSGKAPNLPGVGAPYEPPERPEVVVETDKMSPEECAEAILKALKERGFLR